MAEYLLKYFEWWYQILGVAPSTKTLFAACILLLSALSSLAWIIDLSFNRDFRKEVLSEVELWFLFPLIAWACPAAVFYPLMDLKPYLVDDIGYFNLVFMVTSGAALGLPLIFCPLMLWSGPFILGYHIYCVIKERFKHAA